MIMQCATFILVMDVDKEIYNYDPKDDKIQNLGF